MNEMQIAERVRTLLMDLDSDLSAYASGRQLSRDPDLLTDRQYADLMSAQIRRVLRVWCGARHRTR